MVKRPDTLIEVAEASRPSSGLHEHAMAGFLDTFYMNPERRQNMINPEPPMLDYPKIDAYLAAVAEHLARRWSLSIPAWTRNPARTLHEPVFGTTIEALKPMLLAQSPLAFRKRMIFVEHDPLRRARTPRD